MHVAICHSSLQGDVLLSVNGRSLKGLSHREAAEVLRDAPSVVTLTVLASGRTGVELAAGA